MTERPTFVEKEDSTTKIVALDFESRDPREFGRYTGLEVFVVNDLQQDQVEPLKDFLTKAQKSWSEYNTERNNVTDLANNPMQFLFDIPSVYIVGEYKDFGHKKISELSHAGAAFVSPKEWEQTQEEIKRLDQTV